MTSTIVQQLAAFTAESTFEKLPADVVHECKRGFLDSIGCAVAAIGELKGRAGIEYGRFIGAGDPRATIMGTGDKVSVLGAAFANAELICTLDMDAVLPPGHVSPYVMPAAMALAESLGSSGRSMITAMAVAHEMSNRFGKAMDNLRQTRDGQPAVPAVFGYASTIFGATAALGRLKGHSAETIANSLGIAGYLSPVNCQVASWENAPTSTIKHLMAGPVAQQALTADFMGEFGHRGDLQVLDNREYGYPRFIGTTRWEPENITNGLGSKWNFQAETSYKPYPHCRVVHAAFDSIVRIVGEQGLRPEEIEAMKVYVESLAERPVWLNRNIEHVADAQFSMAHGLAMAAHNFPLGKEWQDPKNVYDPSVMALMDRVTTELHPDYAKPSPAPAGSRPSRVEIRARGQTFVGERRVPKGSPSPDPETRMTDDELAVKFRHNCQGTLPPAHIDTLIDALMNLDEVSNFASIMSLTGRSTAAATGRAEPRTAPVI